MKRKARFTLVELLFLLALMSIGMALLLPALQKSLESSRRAACANNLKSLYEGASGYSDDFGGMLPPPYGWWGSRCTTNINVGTLYWTPYPYPVPSTPERYYFIPPLRLFIDLAYTPIEQFRCDSMDYDCTKGQSHMNYEYRGNWLTGEIFNGMGMSAGKGPTGAATYLSRALRVAGAASSAMFWDQASNDAREQADPTSLTIRQSSKIDGSVWFNSVTEYTRLRWAHQEGGNICRYDGSVKWLANKFDPSPTVNATGSGAWPSFGTTPSYWRIAARYRVTHGGKTYDQGIDIWLNQ